MILNKRILEKVYELISLSQQVLPAVELYLQLPNCDSINLIKIEYFFIKLLLQHLIKLLENNIDLFFNHPEDVGLSNRDKTNRDKKNIPLRLIYK